MSIGAYIHLFAFYFIPLIYISVFVLVPYCPDDCGFAVEPEVSSVQSLSRVRLFATPWIAARQACLSITNSRSSLRFTSIESVTLSSHLILYPPLLLLPPMPPSIRVFSSESTLRMRCPKYWSFSFSIITVLYTWCIIYLVYIITTRFCHSARGSWEKAKSMTGNMK